MSTHFKRILYGGDYNPNQWTKDIWQEDMRIFKDAHINTATINVFSWAKIQPSEHEYNFDELDEIVDMLSKENYDIVFATSTAALPGWMVRKYPEVMFIDYEGRQHKFGGRHNACPNSFVFKHYARELAYKLAERYADNPHVTCWHVSNEYGNECFCENCQKAFRVWLKDKYKTIDALNKAWNMEFWGHTVYDWDDVVPPNALSDGIGSEKTAFAGISIDYRRFYSDSQLACFKMERDAIKSVKPDAFVTTNLMGTFKGLDYFKWAKEMDVVSWDNYPSYDTPWSSIAMTHDLMRGLKDEPFMLMEQSNVKIHIIHSLADDRIPFCEYFIIPYVMWYFFLIGTVIYFAVLCPSKKEYYQYLINIALHPQKPALSDVMLETLSIIAYKQPVTKAEIEKIRGVKCDHAINKLVEYSLVRELGRLDAPGRPILLGTTEEFLRCFGIQDLESLPVPDPVQIEDFKAEAEEEIQLKLDV